MIGIGSEGIVECQIGSGRETETETGITGTWNPSRTESLFRESKVIGLALLHLLEDGTRRSDMNILKLGEERRRLESPEKTERVKMGILMKAVTEDVPHHLVSNEPC